MGRNLAIALYWIFTLWVCISALISVVPQVYWPGELASAEAAISPETCGERLRTLHAELLTGASDSVASMSDPPRMDRAGWLQAWDGRYRAVETPCSGRRSYPLLLRLRYAIEDDLRWVEGDSSLARDVVLALDAEDRDHP
jgi:hypothetical protein